MKGSGDGGNGIKYIGQHVFDFVSSFRNTVNFGTAALDAKVFFNTCDNLDESLPAAGKVLHIDNNNKLGFRTFAQLLADLGGGDITGVSVSDGSNNHDVTSGNFALAFTAGPGIGIGLTGSSTGATNGTISIGSAIATTSSIGAASFSSDNFAVSGAGAVTIKSGGVDLTDEVVNRLPIASGGTNADTAAGARSNLGVDAAGTDNSTNVTLAGTPDYITISGQEITRNQIDLANDVTGTLPVANGGTGVTSLSSLYAYQYLNWEVNTNSFTGTNYELPAANGGFGSDSFTINSGLARNTAIDGTVTMSINSNLQQQGWFVPHACKLIAVSGTFRNNGGESNPRDVAIFVGTPDIGTSNASTYTQRLFAAGDVDGGSANSKIYKVNTVLATPFSLSAGDLIMPAVCNSTGSSTVSMQGNFNIIIATPIFTI